MRTVNTTLVEEYAEELRSVLPLARRAVGTQRPDSPARLASDRANELLLEYTDQKHGNVTHLANELGPDVISLAGLRRRLRAARGKSLGSFSTSNARGTTDPARVRWGVDKIKAGREHSPDAYRDAVREVYAANVSLTAVAEQLDVTYYSLWSAGSTS